MSPELRATVIYCCNHGKLPIYIYIYIHIQKNVNVLLEINVSNTLKESKKTLTNVIINNQTNHPIKCTKILGIF